MTVAEIQRSLLARAYDLGPSGADGDAGPRTIAAVIAFQRSAGLVADGIAGPKTQAALRKADISERRAAPDKPGWLVLAEGEFGVREGAGGANNPRVVQLFAEAGFSGIKQDSVTWSAAAVGAMLRRAGHKQGVKRIHILTSKMHKTPHPEFEMRMEVHCCISGFWRTVLHH